MKKKSFRSVCAVALSLTLVPSVLAAEKLVRKTHRIDVPPGESLRVTYRSNGWLWGDVYLTQGTNERQRVYWWGQKMREGGGKTGFAETNYVNYGVHFYACTEKSKRSIPCFDVRYWLMPNFHNNALYDHHQVTNSWAAWHADYPLGDRREFVFDFRYDAAEDRTHVYLDGQYDGTLKFSGSLTRLEATLSDKSDFIFETYEWKKESAAKLPRLFPSRAAACLRQGAELVLDPSARAALADFDVWSPADSVDQGRHAQTTTRYAFGWNPMYQRTPWANGPEYLQWTIPGGFYLYVDVLCADLPQPGRVPLVGSSLTRFGASNRETFARAFTDLSVARTNGVAKAVGQLRYAVAGEGGLPEQRETPLYLVRQRLDIGQIPHILNDLRIYTTNEVTGSHAKLQRMLPRVMDYLDFEFVGGGTGRGSPTSSVQIFGARLVPAPYSFDIDESVRGNIFADDEVPETGVRVTALEGSVRGSVDWTIFDSDFKTLKSGSQAFELANKGETKRLSFDLTMPELGWYRLVYVFRGAAGEELARHDAAFTLLGRDDREAGFESPYACWPQGTAYVKGRDGTWGFPSLGRANSNPNRREVVAMMRKAGYHSGWSMPVSNETEFADYPITLSAHSQYCNPPRVAHDRDLTPKDIAIITNQIEKAVAFYREEHARFPHCKTIQVLHECGGRELCSEFRDGVPARHGEYLAEKGAPGTFYITEYCKRMKKEFPDCRLSIGNGSSASEMIAHLCRDEGLNLALCDELGIESKGFGSMPEIPDCLESPGMLWALRETARAFGYSNLTMNACSEYVFRPERVVDETWSKARRMQVTDFTLRDYLLSLAWGCRTISTGHLEDCNNDYYETPWGAGGQCKFYPFSYPKRMFTALATFTKVFDRATLSRRVPTGEVSTYGLEFRRDRRVKDWAYAFWTPQHGAEIALELPAGGSFEQIDWQGRRQPLKGNRLLVGSTPTYLLADRPVARARVLRHFQDDLGTDCRVRLGTCADGSARGVEGLDEKAPPMIVRGDYRGATATAGRWRFAAVNDPEAGAAFEAQLLPGGGNGVFALCPEYGRLELADVRPLPAGTTGRLGVMVRGNGSFGRVLFELRDEAGEAVYVKPGYRGYACFEGWAIMSADLAKTVVAKNPSRRYRLAAIHFTTTAKALDPLEAVDNLKPLRFKDVFLLPPEDVSRSYELDAARSAEILREVPEKDL